MPSPRIRIASSDWPFVLISVLLAIGAASVTTEPDTRRAAGKNIDAAKVNSDASTRNTRTQDDDDTLDEGNSRSALGGVYLNSTPPWYLPLYGARTCSHRDGFLCGVGIRLSTLFFLASIKAVMRVDETVMESSVPEGIPSVFSFNAPTEIDISKASYVGEMYRPMFKKAYGHNIALYQFVDYPRTDYMKWKPPFVGKSFPFKGSPVLEDDKLRVELPCRALVYGHRLYGARGLEDPQRKFTAISVQKVWCKDGFCRMGKSLKYEDAIGRRTGAFCGFYSNLGTPIVCGNGEHESLQYILSYIDQQTARNRSCNDEFYAMEVASYQKEILDDVKKFEEEERIKRKSEVTPNPYPVLPLRRTTGGG